MAVVRLLPNLLNLSRHLVSEGTSTWQLDTHGWSVLGQLTRPHRAWAKELFNCNEHIRAWAGAQALGLCEAE